MNTNAPRPIVLVVVNAPSSGPGRFGARLTEAGVAVDVRVGADGLPDSLDGYSGLLLLGGGLMPDDDDAAPWLPAERTLAAEAIANDLPTFGICLGAQVLAAVAGGGVEANSGLPERGSTAILLRDECASDPLFMGLPGAITAIENHRDLITRLPTGAVHLASSERCANQAFRLGDRVWGVQFHPEVTPDVIERWDGDALTSEGFDQQALIALARSNEPRTEAVAYGIGSRFADVVKAA